MSTSLSQVRRATGISRPRAGRPSPTVVATVAANMDRIVRDREDEAILTELLIEERQAVRACQCADRKLHEIDCKTAELIRERRYDIDRRRAENARLTGAIA